LANTACVITQATGVNLQSGDQHDMLKARWHKTTMLNWKTATLLHDKIMRKSIIKWEFLHSSEVKKIDKHLAKNDIHKSLRYFAHYMVR